MIESGRFIPGEESAAYTLTRYVTENGKTVAKEVTINERKIPLEELHNSLL